MFREFHRNLREIDLANGCFALRPVGLHGPFDALALQRPLNDRVTEFARQLQPRAVASLRRRSVY
jgi:hypothetical protein